LVDRESRTVCKWGYFIYGRTLASCPLRHTGTRRCAPDAVPRQERNGGAGWIRAICGRPAHLSEAMTEAAPCSGTLHCVASRPTLGSRRRATNSHDASSAI